MNKLVTKLSVENWILIECQLNEKDVNHHQMRQSHIIVIITKQFYSRHVTTVMQTVFQPLKLSRTQKMLTLVIIFFNIDWERVIINETHTEVSMSVKTIHLFKIFNIKVRKWFLTETSFEFLSAQMTVWINTINTSYWIKSLFFFIWSEKHCHQKNLKYCTFKALQEMRKKHI